MSARARWTVLALAVLLLLAPGLLGDQLLVGRDLLRQFYPRCALLGEALLRGEVPRWNPWSFHGTSWWGPRAGGVLYPGYALFGLLTAGRAMAWFVALHLLLAFAGARRLCAEDTPGAPAAAAGLAYALGGFVSAMFWALPYLVSAAWLPWAVVGARGVARRGWASRGGALIASCVALDMLVGDPQGALLTGLLALAVAWRAAPPPRRRAALGAVALAGGLAVAGSGLVLASIVHELPHTDRALGAWEDARYGFFALPLLGDALVPGVWGHTAQHLGGFWGAPRWGGELPWCGLGVGGLGLAALLASRGSPHTRAWREAAAWVGAGLVLAALDAGAPLGLRYPTKWLVLTALGLARGVGLGFQALEAQPTRARRSLLVLTAACLTLAALVGAMGPRAGAWLEAQGDGVVVRGGAPARAALLHALLRAGLCAGLALTLCWRARSRRAFRAWGLGLLALDLLTAAQPLLLFAPAGTLETPPLVQALHEAGADPPGAPLRYAPKQVFYDHPELDLMVFPLRDRYRVETLRPNLSYAHAIRSVRAFESVRPAALQGLLSDPRFRRLPRFEREARLDAQYVLLAPGDASVRREDVVAELRPTPEDPPLWVVRNPACPPWAYVAGAQLVARDRDAAHAWLVAPTLPGLVLGPEGAPGHPDPPGVSGQVVGVEFTAETVTLRVVAESPGWLVVREAFDGDWQAERDGYRVTTARADLLYRAVQLPTPGEHTVVFRYTPGWWRPGLALSACGWLGLLLWGGWAWRRRRRKS